MKPTRITDSSCIQCNCSSHHKLKISMHNKEFSEAANLISTTDTKSHITYANGDFCDISGYKQHELIGHIDGMVRLEEMLYLMTQFNRYQL